MYILTEVLVNKLNECDRKILYSGLYNNLDEAKDDLQAEFSCYLDEFDIEYGNKCGDSDNGMSAWVLYNGKYTIWNITEVE